MSADELYLTHLESIKKIAAAIARRNYLRPDEIEEFVQEVCVRLLDRDYAIMHKFQGRASITTYLTTVIKRLFYQYRVERWGKWRPSAEAKRLGDKAINFERLLTRDGYTYDEAVKVLTTPGGSQYTEAELEAIYVRLPERGPRPMEVAGDIEPDAAFVDAEAEHWAARKDREQLVRKAARTIDRFLETMPAEDRLILRMRFWDAKNVPDIARQLHLDQKKLYKRLDRLFEALRKALERAGVDREEVGMLLSRGDQEIKFGILPGPGEIPPFRPSHDREGEDVRGGEGGRR